MCFALNAQTSFMDIKEVDSLMDEANATGVYKNPNQAIDLGMSIYNNENYPIKTRVKALMLISLAYSSKRDYQKALEFIMIADSYSKELNNPTLQLSIFFRIGILYQQVKVYDKSFEYLERIEKISLTRPLNDSLRRYLASSYVVKGFLYKDNLNCDIAIDFFDRGIKEYNRLKVSNDANFSIIHYNKGNCYTQLSSYEEAKNSFIKSMEYANRSKANSLLSFAKKGLAGVYTLEGNYQTAIDLLNEALEQSKEVGDLVLYQGIYKGLFENYLALNQWENYQKYYDLFQKTQLELKISERNSISDSLDENHKNYLKKLEQLDLKFSSGIKWIISVIIISLIILYLLFKKNISTNNVLKKKIESLQTLKPKIEKSL